MKFIKHALIGIALYEGVKYLLKNESGQLRYTGLAYEEGYNTPDINIIMAVGSDPEAALGGHADEENQDDPWKKTLADDELRAPDA